MSRFLRFLALGWAALAVFLFSTRSALAETLPPATLVLVVANNRGADLGRAELHYADDDGAKYRALFRASAARPSDIQLLTRFDRDSARLFSEAPDGLPTKMMLEAKVTALAARRAELAREGRAAEFVFIYAGHGDIDNGKGFVQLEDGAFTADDLARLVKRIDATRAHVILDSCNSVFLISPRKPGGRHVATNDDAVRALRERLPRVGVFLSTSSDGEVFEWSELGAGIFSHAVRSGLAGAADADGNGEVSYAELHAFVDIATQEVKNPRYRPRVFARGPDGDDKAALFAPRLAQGRAITLEGPVRTTLRDAEDIPWIDAHVEVGARVRVLVPPALDDGRGTKEILDVSGPSARIVRRESIGGDGAVKAELALARGSSDVFRSLFVRPFGPSALASAEAAAVATKDSDAAPYGLSRDDVSRFSALVGSVAETERSRRQLGSLGIASAGLVAGGMGAFLVARDHDEFARATGWGYIAVGAASLIAAPLVLTGATPGENLRRDFERDLAQGIPSDVAVARAESRLFSIARTERTYRYLSIGVLAGVVALEGVGFTMNELKSDPNLQNRAIFAGGLLIGTVAIGLQLQPTPIERLADVWRAEPTRPRWSLAPMGPGGPGATFSATF